MAIEIKELQIKARVANNQQGESQGVVANNNMPFEQTDEQVARILERKDER